MQRRLLQELKEARGSTLRLASEDSLLCWIWIYAGPDDSPYARSRHQISLEIPSEYPLLPPKAYFTSPLFHPNVHLSVRVFY